MLPYLSLLRPLNGVMAAFAVLIGGVAVLGFEILAFPGILLAAIAAFFIAGAGNAINDCCDVEADRYGT